MKTLVVQGWVGKKTLDFSGPQGWMEVCRKSVEAWAKDSEYDYIFYDNELPYEVDWDARMGYWAASLYKFQWCDHPEYDNVIWIDLDVYVWGMPVIKPAYFAIRCHRYGNKQIDPYFYQLNAGIFWGTGLKDLIAWVKSHPEEWSIPVQYVKAQVNFVNHIGVDFGEYSSITPYVGDCAHPEMCDQRLMRPWVAENIDKVTQLGREDVHRMYRRDDVAPGNFIHFVSDRKFQYFQQFVGYMKWQQAIDKQRGLI